MSDNNGLAINHLNKSSQIVFISREASESYTKNVNLLVWHVNDKLEAHPMIHHLIGGNSFELIQNNLINHSRFMSTVLSIYSLRLLEITLPWYYRMCRARGFSFGYFQIEHEAWKNAVSDCLDNHLSIEINKIYDWFISNHDVFIQNSINDEWSTYSPHCDSDEIQDKLLSLVLNGDFNGSLLISNQFVQTEVELKYYYLNVVCNIMYRIGLLWEKNIISVAEEHVATSIINRITSSLYARFAAVKVCRGKVVVTSGPQDLHEVGARMLADFLEMNGWDVTYLGANTPRQDILEILKKYKPFMLALSASTVFSMNYTLQAIEAIRADPEISDIKIMVGGFAFNSMPDLWHDFGADGFADDANKSVLLANKWWGERIE